LFLLWYEFHLRGYYLRIPLTKLAVTDMMGKPM